MTKEQVAAPITSQKITLITQALPLEVVNLIDVCARIEARRQAKLREARKECVNASTEIAS